MTNLNKAMCKEGRIFDPEITVFRQGKKIKVQDWIEAGRDGTNVYEIIEKYGLDYAKNHMGLPNLKAIQEDLSHIHGLQDLLEINKRAQRNWEQLPLEIRKKFNNNRNDFVKNGNEWLKSEINRLSKNEKLIENGKIQNNQNKEEKGE